MLPTSQLLTASDLAAKIRTTEAAIYTARYRGELPPAIKRGRRLLWRSEDVDRWLASKVEPSEIDRR